MLEKSILGLEVPFDFMVEVFIVWGVVLVFKLFNIIIHNPHTFRYAMACYLRYYCFVKVLL